jgi:hypothetical protein
MAAVGLVAVGFLVVTSGGYHSSNAARVAVPYRDGPTVYTGERQAYQELAHRWSGGAILNDPADGSPWAYALYGLPLVFKTPLTPPAKAADFGADRLALLDHFDDGLDDPVVARAVQDLDVRWVIVGDGFASPNVSRAPGLRHLDDMPGVHLVWSDDVAKIYRVDRNLS